MTESKEINFDDQSIAYKIVTSILILTHIYVITTYTYVYNI